LSAPAFAAQAQAPTAAMMAPVRRIVAFVNNETAIPAGTYAAGATITDEFAPFHWTTGDVGTQWSARFTMYNNSAGITKPYIVLGAPTEYVASAISAYVVFPGRFTPLVHGKPSVESGFWTFVVVKTDDGWRVVSQTWAGVTFK
jgi:UDP-N-acetylmuramyl tripeptide synthase